MGSTFVKSNKNRIRVPGVYNDIEIPFYMQFVPGIVTDVVTSTKHYAYSGTKRNINSILATKHVGKDLMDRKGSQSELENRYVPLMRGMADVPMVGDPVLLCTIGNVNYYLGPLNPENNPNYNKDHLNRKETDYKINASDHRNYSKKIINGVSTSFIDGTEFSRVQKSPNIHLDNPGKNFEADLMGDMVFEGRYGNSIRIGSRNVNPLVFISNGRLPKNETESPLDSSFLGMIHYGSLRQHFEPMYTVDEVDSDTGEVTSTSYKPFVLSSDEPSLENDRSLNSMIQFLYGGRETYDPTSVLYGYGMVDQSETMDPIPIEGSQMFLRSDRITLDSRKDDIFLSSFGNVHIGTGQNLTISTKSDVIIESNNIYLGKDSKDKKDNNETPEPLVLGEQLRLVLKEMLDILSSFKVTGVMAGISGPPEPGVLGKIETLKGKLEKNVNFLSKFHYIESNEVEK